MTVKSLRRQLMAAIAMVVVSAVALSSSTYAWFVQSSEVTAEGMKVQAAAESGIEISYAGSETWGSVATSSAETGVLYPTSTNDVTKWYHAKANASTDKTALNGTYEILSLNNSGATDGGSKYFLLTEYTIRSASKEVARNLTIDSVTATTIGTSSAKLNEALRVAIVIEGDNNGEKQNVRIYAPNGGDTEYNIWDGSSGDGPSVLVTANNGNNAESTTVSVPNTGVKVKVYAWYEGEDTELKSINLPGSGLTIDTMNLTIKFSATV